MSGWAEFNAQAATISLYVPWGKKNRRTIIEVSVTYMALQAPDPCLSPARPPKASSFCRRPPRNSKTFQDNTVILIDSGSAKFLRDCKTPGSPASAWPLAFALQNTLDDARPVVSSFPHATSINILDDFTTMSRASMLSSLTRAAMLAVAFQPHKFAGYGKGRIWTLQSTITHQERCEELPQIQGLLT